MPEMEGLTVWVFFFPTCHKSQLKGPALDCHMLRWSVSFGIICGLISRNSERVVDCLKNVFPKDLYCPLNETPASISQIMHRRLGRDLTLELIRVADQQGMQDGMRRFLNFYPEQPSLEDAV